MISTKFFRAVSAGLVLAGALAAPTFASGSVPVTIVAPASVTPNVTTSATVRLPDGVAAVEGRVLIDSSVADLVAVVAPGGHSLSPTKTTNGFAFGVFGMKPSDTKNDLSLVVRPHVAGQLELRVVIDAAANAAGRRISLPNQTASGRLQVGRGAQLMAAPSSSAHAAPGLASQPVRGLFGRSVIGADDLDIARAAWYGNRSGSSVCTTNAHLDGDANGDGCVDIVDLQLISAAQGARVTSTASGAPVRSATPTDASASSGVNRAPAQSFTYTVTSTADTPDATPGDGICADSQARCTLRAAITESNQHAGTQHVNFNLPGTAPVTIQLGSSTMSLVGSANTSVIIDGYSQPGSQPNTAQYGFNGIPGVFVRGNGYSSTKYIFYTSRSGNTIRGIAMGNAYRGILLDTPNATNNTIAGDWFGFNANGSNAATMHSGPWLNNGANHNFIGTPALADRNVAGNQEKAYYLYGAGTDSNTFQNNIACISPSGATAPCSTGFDVDFGPKSNLIGGMGANQLNVVGPTLLNGIELSHGWDPNTNHINTPQYQINYNQIVGNWVGFRADGNYDRNYVSAQYNPSADNGQALHAYDGSNYNTFDSNYVGAAFDGVTFAQNDSAGDIARNNIIGVSPLGQAAPLARYGIYVIGNTRAHVIQGNVIRHTGSYGIALLDPNVLQVLISQNIVTDTNAAAIYEAPDPNDPSTGADNLLAPPVITAANPGTVTGTGIAGATVEIFQASKPAGQSGLPIAYLGSTTVAGDGTWSLSVAIQQGNTVTGTQHIASGNSSVLGTNVSVGAPPPPPVASFTYQQENDSLTVDFTDTSSGGPKSWAWDFGDGGTSEAQSPSHTFPQAGDYQVTLIAANEGGGNSVTQTVSVAPLSTGTAIASDSFTRTISGWGSADAGGPYTIDGNSANFQVATGYGQMTLPKAAANRGATLNNVSAADVDAVVRVAADKVAAGASFIAYLPVRQNAAATNAYRPKLIFNTNGTISVGAGVLVNGSESAAGPAIVVPGLTQSANSFVWLRVKVTGANPTTIKVKAWAEGTTEPSGWQFSATNSAASLQGAGAVGLRAYANTGMTNGPLVVSFDDLSVTAAAVPPPPSGIATDLFDRTLSSTWGSADNGGQYTLQGTASNYNVANGAGTMTVPAANTTRSALLNDVSASDVDVTFRVSFDKVASGVPTYIYAVARRVSNNEYRPRIVLNPNGNITVGASRVVNGAESSLAPGVVTGLSQAANTFFWIRAQVIGTNPTTINVKVWADGTPEPSTWQFSATDSSAALQGPGSVGVRAYVSSSSPTTPLTLSFDDYSVVAPAP
jgi:CSLREA domain-containing protein